MWIIALKRIRLSLRNGWFLGTWAVGVVIAVATVWVSWIDYQERVRLFEASRLGGQMAVERAGSYAALELGIERPPGPLGLLSRGVGEQLGSRAAIPGRFGEPRITRRDQPVAEDARRLNVDLSWALALVVGFSCLFAGHAVVNGEREKGTLKQQIAKGMPRSTLLLGEFVGGALSVALPCALLLLGFLVWVASGVGPHLEGEEWWRAGLFFGLVALYGWFWLAFSLLSSVVFRQVETSLVVGVLAWAFCFALYPQFLGWAVSRFTPDVPGAGASFQVPSAGSGSENLDADRSASMERRNVQALEHRRYRRLAALLPVTAFLDGGQLLAGTSAADHEHFRRHVDAAERSFIAWQVGKVALHPNREYVWVLGESLDIGGLPEPVYEPVSIGDALRQASLPAGALAFGTVGLLIAAGVGLERLDVR